MFDVHFFKNPPQSLGENNNLVHMGFIPDRTKRAIATMHLLDSLKLSNFNVTLKNSEKYYTIILSF
jgi:hypothetical protein